MRVQVNKASDRMFWYARCIGESFYVQRIDTDRYWVREQDTEGYLNFILIADASVVY